MFNESFEKWCINQGYVKLAPSPLIRNDNHLFTFSPFEDLENNYLKEKRFKGFKVQDCFRNVFPQNLVNPLSTPLQKLVSIHDFSFSDSLGELKNCVNGFLIDELGLNETDVYYIVPDDAGVVALFGDNQIPEEKTIVIDKNRLVCKLPFDGIHYYIKVIYAYKGGVVTVANFVLVNYQKKNFQLDSVIYPERIKMIMDDGDFLYDLKIYEKCRDEFFIKIIDDKRTFNFVLGNLNAIDHLRRLVFESNNKQGYTLKRLEKELFQECLTKEIDFEQMMTVFCQNGVVDGNCRDYLSEREKKFVKNKRQCLRTLKKRLKSVKIVDEALFNVLHGELGCTKEDVISTSETLGIKNEIKKEVIQHRFAFYYEKSKNTMTDPKNQYC